MTTHQKQLEAFRRGNELAAEIIRADVAKYGGEGALLVQWARTILRRSENLVAELKSRAGLERTEGTNRQ
jgi:hypothetical protein